MVGGIMGYILDSMVITVQFFVGLFFWGMLSTLFAFIIILYQRTRNKEKPEKIYQGQKIVIQGGKEDD